jgi:hypothetical protein
MSSEGVRQRGKDLKERENDESGNNKQPEKKLRTYIVSKRVDDDEVARRTILAFKVIAGIIIVVVVGSLFFMFTRLGIGRKFPDQAMNNASPLLPASSLHIAATLSIPPGNIAVSSDGTIYFSFHPHYETFGVKVAKVLTEDQADAYMSSLGPDMAEKTKRSSSHSPILPFPNEEYQSLFKTVLSMRIDSLDRLWLLDYSKYAFAGKPCLYGFALNTATKGSL